MRLSADSMPFAAANVSEELHDFSAFVRTRRDRAVRLAYRLLGDQASAEDVAQNAFLKAYRALASFRGESSLDTWFYRIVVHEAHRHRRWNAVRRLWSATSLEDVPEPSEEPPQGDPGLRRRIRQAMDALSPNQREVFTLVHLEGFSVADTAEIVGKAIGTVKSHLHRALASLRNDLEDLASRSGAEAEVDGGMP